MDSALAALLIILVIAISVSALSAAFFRAQEGISDAMLDMADRMEAAHRADLSVVAVQADAAALELTLSNTGQRSLGEWEAWDLIVQYESDAGVYQVQRLAYGNGVGQWRKLTIYQDETAATTEAYNRGLLDPGEALLLQATLEPAIGPEAPGMLVLSTDGGLVLRQSFVSAAAP